VDPEEWKVQLPQIHQHYAGFGDSASAPQVHNPDRAAPPPEPAGHPTRAGEAERAAEQHRAVRGPRQPAPDGPARPRLPAAMPRQQLAEPPEAVARPDPVGVPEGAGAQQVP
jgi:hypothetical protein